MNSLTQFFTTLIKLTISIFVGIIIFWFLFRMAYQFLPSNFHIELSDKNNDIAVLAFSVNILQMIIGIISLVGGILAFIGYREIKTAAENSAKRQAITELKMMKEQLKKEELEELSRTTKPDALSDTQESINKYEQV